MVGVGVPLQFIARKLSSKVVNAAQGTEEPQEASSDEETADRRAARRVNRRQG